MSIGTIASQAFNPTKLDGVKVWLDATDPATIIDDGSFVSAWGDKSSQEVNNAFQFTGCKQPTTGTDTINGRNVIKFDGINDLLRIAGFAGGIISQPNTIYIVFEMPVLSVSRGKILDGSNNGGRHVFETRGSDSDKWELFSGTVLRGGVGLASTPFIAALIYDGDDTEGYINGSFDIDGPVGAQPLDGLVMTTNFGEAEFFELKIGEIIVKNGASPTAERLEVQNYLANRWDINIDFPIAFSDDFSVDFS